jgi:hypothetical protein
VCGVEGVRTAYGGSAEEDLRTEAGELGRGRWTGGLWFSEYQHLGLVGLAPADMIGSEYEERF